MGFWMGEAIDKKKTNGGFSECTGTLPPFTVISPTVDVFKFGLNRN
jgi:hypothetical protein